jgi:hypothetical protein
MLQLFEKTRMNQTTQKSQPILILDRIALRLRDKIILRDMLGGQKEAVLGHYGSERSQKNIFSVHHRWKNSGCRGINFLILYITQHQKKWPLGITHKLQFNKTMNGNCTAFSKSID